MSNLYCLIMWPGTGEKFHLHRKLSSIGYTFPFHIMSLVMNDDVHSTFVFIIAAFYRYVLCWHAVCRYHVSVRLSITSRCSTKTAESRIMQTTPYGSAGTLVF